MTAAPARRNTGNDPGAALLTDAAEAAPAAAVPAAKPPRQAAKAFIFVTVVLDVISLGIIIPVLPLLIKQLEGGDTAKAAFIAGVFGATWAAMQFVCSPILGALSDRFGRRPVLLISLAGLGIDKIVMALAPSVAILFIGRIISGATAASFSTAAAYMTDITPPEKRAETFGMLAAGFGLGFVLGPALGGILGEIDPRLPFWAAAGLCLANAAWGYFVLPESLPPEKRTPKILWGRANPFGSAKLLSTTDVLKGLAGVHFLMQLGYVALHSVFVLYSNYRYGWSERDVGLTLALVGVCSAVVSGGLVKPIVKAIGERRAMALGLACGATAFVIYGLAPTGFIFMLGIPFGAMMGLYGPAAQSLMTQQLGASEQGRLQGALSSIMGLTGMIGPLLFTSVFGAIVAHMNEGGWLHMPGIPFLIGAALFAGALVLSLHVTRVRTAAA